MCSYGNQATLPGGGRVIGLTNIIHLMLRKYTHTQLLLCAVSFNVSPLHPLYTIYVCMKKLEGSFATTLMTVIHTLIQYTSYHILHKNTSLYIPSKVLMKLVL